MPTVSVRPYHTGQYRAWQSFTRFTALRCGRRWGKSELLAGECAEELINGGMVGWFAPDQKRWTPEYNNMEVTLDPIKRSSNKSSGTIETIVECIYNKKKRASIDFWTLNDVIAGRGRQYSLVVIDEAAFVQSSLMMDIWRGAIKPTLLDWHGRVIVASNTNGIDAEQFFWQICNDPQHGFGPRNKAPDADAPFGFYAPSRDNPFLPVADLEALRTSEHPLVFAQEYEAKFVDWSGDALFALDKWLVDGKPVSYPAHCDSVYCVIDTATKTGRYHDGTAVTFYAADTHTNKAHPLTILDWNISQIPGDLLEVWIPDILQQGETYARQCRARAGFLGAFIEDKASGMVLIQQGARRGWKTRAIDSKLTSVGKDERAISVSGYHFRERIKISQQAFDKVVVYKATSRNHLRSQVNGFRIGDKDGSREDDLLDTYTYGVAIGVGNIEGF
jgi:hypothetical protein